MEMRGVVELLVVLSISLTISKCENLKGLSVDQLANRLWSNLKLRDDSTLTEKDIEKEFLRLFDMDGDGNLKKFEFVEKWNSLVHDSVDTAADVFNRLDIARDDQLTSVDYSAHFSAADRDSNKKLTALEFTKFIIMMHPDTKRHDEL